jgi:hypothetical protein
MASSGERAGAVAAAETIAPFWNAAVRCQAALDTRSTASGLLGKALRAAPAVADPAAAATLLCPFRIDGLAAAHVKPLARTAGRYGQQWTAGLLRSWFGGNQPGWQAPAGRDLHQWATDRLPGLCTRLRAAGAAGEATAQRLLDLAWERKRGHLRGERQRRQRHRAPACRCPDERIRRRRGDQQRQ